MSARNGDRSRFQISRKRRLLRRQRVQEVLTALRQRTAKAVVIAAAGLESGARIPDAETNRLDASAAPQPERAQPKKNVTHDGAAREKAGRVKKAGKAGSKP